MNKNEYVIGIKVKNNTLDAYLTMLYRINVGTTYYKARN